MSRSGKQTLVFDRPPLLAAHSSIVGPKEGKGPLADDFDEILEDDLLGQRSWEFAESEMLRRCAARAMNEGGAAEKDVHAFISGDLNDQLLASCFAARQMNVPFLGIYGACSTFVEGLLLGAALVSCGYLESALCGASSHFCTAERQFRYPLELGTQRPPAAQWTATAAGVALIRRAEGPAEGGLYIRSGTLGRVVDMRVNDANHMGAAMAPAVCDTICAHLADTGRKPEAYDQIVTGDLGWIGRNILLELLREKGVILDEARLFDCGTSLFYEEQDAHAGGSGCGCIASVSCGPVFKRMKRGELRRALLVGSGALLSPTSSQQGESIPGIAYAAEVEAV